MSEVKEGIIKSLTINGQSFGQRIKPSPPKTITVCIKTDPIQDISLQLALMDVDDTEQSLAEHIHQTAIAYVGTTEDAAYWQAVMTQLHAIQSMKPKGVTNET